MLNPLCFCFFFFFNDPPPTEIYPLSLHDALPIFAAFYRQDWDRLARLAMASSRWLAGVLGVATPAVLASELGVEGTGAAENATERLVALCRAVGADTYLAGQDGARYMDTRRFVAARDPRDPHGHRPPRSR